MHLMARISSILCGGLLMGNSAVANNATNAQVLSHRAERSADKLGEILRVIEGVGRPETIQVTLYRIQLDLYGSSQLAESAKGFYEVGDPISGDQSFRFACTKAALANLHLVRTLRWAHLPPQNALTQFISELETIKSDIDGFHDDNVNCP